jgi:hypothetical protein
VKRSKRIRLVLIGGLSAGALAGCDSDVRHAPVTQDSVYTNNYYLPGVGYYHAPFRAWYPLPYNHFDERSQRFFYGGQWAAAPHQSITNISGPTSAAAQQAQAQRTDVERGGFGSTSRGHYFHTYS